MTLICLCSHWSDGHVLIIWKNGALGDSVPRSALDKVLSQRLKTYYQNQVSLQQVHILIYESCGRRMSYLQWLLLVQLVILAHFCGCQQTIFIVFAYSFYLWQLTLMQKVEIWLHVVFLSPRQELHFPACPALPPITSTCHHVIGSC